MYVCECMCICEYVSMWTCVEGPPSASLASRNLSLCLLPLYVPSGWQGCCSSGHHFPCLLARVSLGGEECGGVTKKGV